MAASSVRDAPASSFSVRASGNWAPLRGEALTLSIAGVVSRASAQPTENSNMAEIIAMRMAGVLGVSNAGSPT